MPEPPSNQFDSNSQAYKLLIEIKDAQNTMLVKLFGRTDADQESETGRLPLVEHSAHRAHERIDKLEQKMWYAVGFASAIAGLVMSLMQKYVLR